MIDYAPFLKYFQYVFQLSQLCPDDEIVLITASKLIKAVANYQQVGDKNMNISAFMKDINLWCMSTLNLIKIISNFAPLLAYCIGA